MDPSQRIVDSLKLLQDWSKWLISLQTVVCVGLWPKLTSGQPVSGAIYAAWMLFWASIVIAAILLLCISLFVRRVDQHGERDMKKIWILVGLQYGCFLAGLGCFAWKILNMWSLT